MITIKRDKETQLIERVTVVGPMFERDEIVKQFSIEDGWRNVRWGPLPVGELKIDPSHFKLVYERVIANVSAEEYLRRSG